jgi:hypothetical protein
MVGGPARPWQGTNVAIYAADDRLTPDLGNRGNRPRPVGFDVTDRRGGGAAHDAGFGVVELEAWLWCSADVTLDSAPSCPPDTEQILEVRAVDKAEAQRLLAADAD